MRAGPCDSSSGEVPLALEQQLKRVRRLYALGMDKAARRSLAQLNAASLVALAETLLVAVGVLSRLERRLGALQNHLAASRRPSSPGGHSTAPSSESPASTTSTLEGE